VVSIRVGLPATASQADVVDAVRRLNADPACTGYIVQLPLPKGLDANAVLELMDPAKDADGLHPTSLGRLVLGQRGPLPCTPRAIVELLRRHDVPIAGWLAPMPGGVGPMTRAMLLANVVEAAAARPLG